ncbi:hypothetical protein DRO30_01375 [Candidatus Bathyarchaeota archaeon]|nr:MAG: hypothetical protein DRO30_01375 [Candidatus Bathyarchaeota archaeon]
MNTFPTLVSTPSLPSPFSIIGSTLPTVKKMISESRYPMITRTGTRNMREWKVSYKSGFYLTTTDRSTLQTFFDNNMGLFFNWLNEDDSTSYVVFFNMDSLIFETPNVHSNVYYVDLILTGV